MALIQNRVWLSRLYGNHGNGLDQTILPVCDDLTENEDFFDCLLLPPSLSMFWSSLRVSHSGGFFAALLHFSSSMGYANDKGSGLVQLNDSRLASCSDVRSMYG